MRIRPETARGACREDGPATLVNARSCYALAVNRRDFQLGAIRAMFQSH